MATESSDNPFAPPSAQVRDVNATPGQRELATRGSRLAAIVIDILSFWAVGFGGLLLVGGFRTDTMLEFSPALAGAFIPALVLLGVNLYLIAKRSQTVGKLAMKICITRPDGARAGFWRIFGLRMFVNGLICSIPFIGTVYWIVDSLLIFRDSHLCAHDQLADTVVVKAA